MYEFDLIYRVYDFFTSLFGILLRGIFGQFELRKVFLKSIPLVATKLKVQKFEHISIENALNP